MIDYFWFQGVVSCCKNVLAPRRHNCYLTLYYMGGHSASDLILDGHFRSKDEIHKFDQWSFFQYPRHPIWALGYWTFRCINEKCQKFDPKVDHFCTFSLKLRSCLVKFIDRQEVLTSGGWFVVIRHFTPHSMGKKKIFLIDYFWSEGVVSCCKKVLALKSHIVKRK